MCCDDGKSTLTPSVSVQVELIVVFGMEAHRAVIAALDDVPGNAGEGETGAARHGGEPGRIKILVYQEINRGLSPIIVPIIVSPIIAILENCQGHRSREENIIKRGVFTYAISQPISNVVRFDKSGRFCCGVAKIIIAPK